MSYAQRNRVLASRSGRCHRTGKVPASYKSTKIYLLRRPLGRESPLRGYRPEVQRSSRRLYGGSFDWPSGESVMLADLAILQLIGEETSGSGVRQENFDCPPPKDGRPHPLSGGKEFKKKGSQPGKKSSSRQGLGGRDSGKWRIDSREQRMIGLDVSSVANCIFCKIAAGEVPGASRPGSQ